MVIACAPRSVGERRRPAPCGKKTKRIELGLGGAYPREAHPQPVRPAEPAMPFGTFALAWLDEGGGRGRGGDQQRGDQGRVAIRMVGAVHR